MNIVKCPFCEQTYDITNFTPGDILQCGNCSTNLRVPISKKISAYSIRKTFSYLSSLSKKEIAIAASSTAFLIALSLVITSWLKNDSPLQQKSENGIVVSATQVVPQQPKEVAKKDVGQTAGTIETPPENINAITNKLYEEFGPKFYISTNRPYLMAIEKSDAYLAQGKIEEYRNMLNTLYKSFMDKFKDVLGLQDVNEYLLVIILNSRDSFDEYFLHSRGVPISPEINGLYEYKNRRLIVYNEPHSEFNSLLHEGTHQLIHYFAKNTINVFWLQEGLSNYFEPVRTAGNQDINKDRIRDYKAALREGKLVKIDRLVKLSIADFWDWFYKGDESISANSADAKVYYAESWALVYFLLNYKDGAFQVNFNSYFKKALDGEVEYEDFIKNFGDIETLEKEFFDFMSAL